MKKSIKDIRKLSELEYIHAQNKHDVDLEQHVWVTAAGDRIPVREMRTSHIQRTIKCWNGQGKTKIPKGYLGGKAKWLKIFGQELVNRN